MNINNIAYACQYLPICMIDEMEERGKEEDWHFLLFGSPHISFDKKEIEGNKKDTGTANYISI